MPTSPATDLWEVVALEAERESPLWGAALRPLAERETEPVFSPLAEERFALGLETIYEAYLLHYGRPRLFTPEDDDTALFERELDIQEEPTERKPDVDVQAHADPSQRCLSPTRTTSETRSKTRLRTNDGSYGFLD